MFDVPETNEEVVIKENLNKKIIYIIVGIVVLLTASVIALKNYDFSKNLTDTATISTEDSEVSPYNEEGGDHLVEANVAVVDSDNNELRVNIFPIKNNATEAQDVEVEERVVKITENTYIYKLILDRAEDGSVVKSGQVEVNISDIRAEDRVVIEYVGTEDDKVLGKVKTITTTIDTDNFDDVYEEESLKVFKDFPLGIKGLVVSTDINQSVIRFNSYSFDKQNTAISSAYLREKGKVYTIDDTSRIHIDHARTEIPFSSLKSEDVVFIIFDDGVDLTQENIPTDSIIIIN